MAQSTWGITLAGWQALRHWNWLISRPPLADWRTADWFKNGCRGCFVGACLRAPSQTLVFFMYGLRQMVPTPLLLNPFHSRLPAAGPGDCPTCSTPVPPAVTTREEEYSDMEWTRSTLSSEDFLSHQSLSIGPISPAQTSPFAAGPAFEGRRFLQFNCDGIQHCQVERQNFLHRHRVLPACVQGTELGVNSSLKEFTDYGTIRCNRPNECGAGLNCYSHPPFRSL